MATFAYIPTDLSSYCYIARISATNQQKMVVSKKHDICAKFQTHTTRHTCTPAEVYPNSQMLPMAIL